MSRFLQNRGGVEGGPAAGDFDARESDAPRGAQSRRVVSPPGDDVAFRPRQGLITVIGRALKRGGHEEAVEAAVKVDKTRWNVGRPTCVPRHPRNHV